jgi:hypothetical protein
MQPENVSRDALAESDCEVRIRSKAALLKPLPPRKEKGKRRRRVAPDQNGDDRQLYAASENPANISIGSDLHGDIPASTLFIEPYSKDTGNPNLWEMVILIDVDAKSESDAETEVKRLYDRLERRLRLSSFGTHAQLQDGWRGKIVIMCTATLAELETEAEILGLLKPMRLKEKIVKDYSLDPDYGRVTAPYSAARRTLFHEVPYFRTAARSDTDKKDRDCLRKPGKPEDKKDDKTECMTDRSGLRCFSATERQALIERIVENEASTTQAPMNYNYTNYIKIINCIDITKYISDYLPPSLPPSPPSLSPTLESSLAPLLPASLSRTRPSAPPPKSNE